MAETVLHLFPYFLIIVAAVMFSTQFIFQQKYQRKEGTTVVSSLKFSFLVSLVQIVLVAMISSSGFAATELHFSWGSAGIGFITALSLVANAYFCVKVFECADMTLFSIFEMLGGMTLPFLAGVLFFNEGMTVLKGVDFVLISLAILIETGKVGVVKGKQFFYYMGLFISNGMAGVLNKWNITLQNPASTHGYLITYCAFTALISGVALLFLHFVKKEKIFSEKPLKMLDTLLPYGVISILGSMCMLLALKDLPASVQYPMSTGGTIVFSLIISALRKEKPGIRGVAAAAVAFGASVVIAL